MKVEAVFPGSKTGGEFGHPTESVLLGGSLHFDKNSPPNHLASTDSPNLAETSR